jgi:hypothetical protein
MYCHDPGFDSGLIFPPFSHDKMQANIKATTVITTTGTVIK